MSAQSGQSIVIVALILLVVLAGAARAENTTLYVQNNTDDYITVHVDDYYGCNTSSGSTCSIPVTVGDHELEARRHDTGDITTRSQHISSDGFTWEPW